MAAIRKLDPSLVNKIAAGEVIERPASVVKELLENALDAGATRIDVVLEEGGVSLIRVTDNGGGMGADDLPMAVAPHATSKITAVDDLFAVRTLGFRGEALASIASVSHMRIVSRPAGQIEGYELTCIDGELSGPRPCAAPEGTTIEVRNLFGNVPARRKFLRQGPTEMSHATEQVARLALAHPGVAFSLTHNGRTMRSLPAANDRRGRIADFYGAELAACLLDVSSDERGLRVEALMAPPAQSKASTKWQYLFLNGRWITDRRIGFAIREAYRGLVEHDRFPVVFIFLTTDPQAYDVNVHPTKIEVRWRDAGLVQSQVLAVLREALLSHDLTPPLDLAARLGSGERGPWNDSPQQSRARQALADYLKSIDPTQARLTFSAPPFASEAVRPSIRTTFVGGSPPSVQSEDSHAPSRDQSSDWAGGIDADLPGASDPAGGRIAEFETATPGELESPGSGDLSPTPAGAVNRFGGASIIQVHNTYLVAQTDEGMVIIDQHALHERILYERFRERVLAGPLESQRLLIPQTFEASPAQTRAAEQHRELLATLGIELSAFGDRTLAVQSVPVLLGDIDAAGLAADLLDRLAETAAPSPESLVHQALDMMACKAAVKAGDPLTQEEMFALLAQRHLVDRSSNCPHGRPTTLQLTTRELERQFRRI